MTSGFTPVYSGDSRFERDATRLLHLYPRVSYPGSVEEVLFFNILSRCLYELAMKDGSVASSERWSWARTWGDIETRIRDRYGLFRGDAQLQAHNEVIAWGLTTGAFNETQIKRLLSSLLANKEKVVRILVGVNPKFVPYFQFGIYDGALIANAIRNDIDPELVSKVFVETDHHRD